MHARAAESLQFQSFNAIPLEYPGVGHTRSGTPGSQSSIADIGEALEAARVLEIASRMLSARSDAERDQLLGAVMTLAADRAGSELSAPLGSALGGLLKSVAQKGSSYPTPGRCLGLELDGLNPNEQEFEATVQFVRLAGEAARHAAEEELIAPPHLAAQAVLASAAEVYAPSLLQTLQPPSGWSGERVRSDHEIGILGTEPRSGRTALRIEPFEYDPTREYFLGGMIRSVGRAASGAVRTVTRTAGDVARIASKAADTVGRIPILGDVARAGIGAARLSLGSTAIAIDAGSRLARGQSLGAALKGAVTGQVDAVRDQLKLAEMVTPLLFRVSVLGWRPPSERRTRWRPAVRSPRLWWQQHAAPYQAARSRRPRSTPH